MKVYAVVEASNDLVIKELFTSRDLAEAFNEQSEKPGYVEEWNVRDSLSSSSVAESQEGK